MTTSTTSPPEQDARVTRSGLAIAAVVCAGVVVSHIFGRFSYSLLLPAISDDLVDDFTGAGFLGASYFAGYLLGVVGVTIVARAVEPVVLLRTGLGLSALALTVIATAPRFSVLASGVFFAGLAGAGIWIPAPTIATSGLPVRHRGLVMGALTASMGVGMLAVSQGTTLYRSIIDDDGAWRPVFGVEALVTVAIFVAALAFVRSALRTDAPPAARLFDASGLRSIAHWKLLTAAYAIFAVTAGAWAQFLGVALDQDAGFSPAQINNGYSLLAAAAIPGALGFGRLSDRIGRDRSIALACAMCVVASLMIAFASRQLGLVGAALYGAGSFAVPPLTAAAVRDHLADRSFATAFGLMTILYAAVSGVAAQLAGVLADATGSFMAVYLGLALACVAAGVAALTRVRASSS